MGVHCSRECCSGPDKNGKYIGNEEDNEVVRVVSRRHPNQATLSMVAEDAYESQLSQQNSHLLQAQNSMINSNASNNNPAGNNTSANQTNNSNAIKQWANFQVVHVMDRMIQVSSTNESYQFYSLSAAVDPETLQMSLVDIQGSFNSPGNSPFLNGKNNNINNGNNLNNYDGQASQGLSLANNTVSLFLPSNPSKTGFGNSTSNDQFNQDYLQRLQPTSDRSTKNQQQTNDSERTKTSRNTKQPGNKPQSDQNIQDKPCYSSIFPLEAQLYRLLERIEIENDNNNINNINTNTNKKSKKIVDFQPLDELIQEVSATWKDLLIRVSNKLGIGPNSNLLLINNYLFQAIHHTSLKPIGATLLGLVFEQLQCQRFTLCSTGPCILKSLAKRTGVVFDVSYNQMVFCLPVLDGKSINSQSQLLQYSSGKIIPANDKDTYDTQSQNGINAINVSNLNTNNMSNYNTPTFNGNNNNNNNNNNNLSYVVNPNANSYNTEFLMEVTEFLEKLDKEFLKTCLISRSFVLNSNCQNSEGIAASIVTALKIIQSSFFLSAEDSQCSIDNTTNPKPQLSSSSSVLYQSQHLTQSQQQINQQQTQQKSKNKGQASSQVGQSQSWQLTQPVQLVSTQQPSVAALHGAIELIKLNVVQTVSRSRYEKYGAEEIIKSHGFI